MEFIEKTYGKLQIKRFLIRVDFYPLLATLFRKGGIFVKWIVKKERARSHPGFAAERERTEKENTVW